MYDLAIVGCGGIGSGVLYHAAKQGVKVIGIDQFTPPHDRGSSHGQTRIIRQAYFEHPDYVPLLLDAYEDWHRLELEASQQLLVETGLLQVGPMDGEVVPGVLRSASEHQLDVAHLSPSDLAKRFPMFRFPPGHEGAFEAKAGYLKVEACVQAHLDLAVQHGASTSFETTVLGLEPRSKGVAITTSREQIEAQRVVIAPGAWAGRWLSEKTHPLRVLRKHLYWFDTIDKRWDLATNCPLYLFENSQGCFYGFPRINASGLKVAEHSGGTVVEDPSMLDRSLDERDLARTKGFLRDYFDGEFRLLDHQVCMYTMTADQHFWIDPMPGDERVIIACGFSGHGFKFASVLGRLITEWVRGGKRDRRLEFLGAR